MAYSVSVRQRLNAQHMLPIETGPESTPHAHPFIVDVDVKGPSLDANGFLLDIIQLNHALHHLLSRFDGTILNDQHEFQETIPTLEEIARVLWINLLPAFKNTPINELRVRVWESSQASAAYEGAIPP